MSGAVYVVAPAAEADLLDAAEWIAADDPQAARRFLDAAYKAFDMLVARPRLGHRRSDLTPLDVRFWPVRRRYLVVYRDGTPLRILRVLSAYRDARTILSGGEQH